MRFAASFHTFCGGLKALFSLSLMLGCFNPVSYYSCLLCMKGYCVVV